MKNLLLLLLFSVAALAEDPKPGPGNVTTTHPVGTLPSNCKVDERGEALCTATPEMPHLTAEDLLPYYKAQAELDKLLAAPAIMEAQAKLAAQVQKLRAKCGDQPITGDGKAVEYDCAPKPAPEKAK